MLRRTTLKTFLVAGVAVIPGCAYNGQESTRPPTVFLRNPTDDTLMVDLTVLKTENEQTVFEQSVELDSDDAWEYPNELQSTTYEFQVTPPDAKTETYTWEAKPNHGLDIEVNRDDVTFSQWING